MNITDRLTVRCYAYNIESLRASGWTDDRIRKALHRLGTGEDVVTAAFSEADKPTWEALEENLKRQEMGVDL